ncbi:MAG: DUF2207 domain-containing protein [Deltaproteobacteria bacterium]|nr:DUF2207 domain-containing protein [Deltaproteobacteria bacterium]
MKAAPMAGFLIGDGQSFFEAGNHNFHLEYLLENPLTSGDSRERFKWDVTGQNWSVPIKKANFSLFLPSTVNPKSIKIRSAMTNGYLEDEALVFYGKSPSDKTRQISLLDPTTRKISYTADGEQLRIDISLLSEVPPNHRVYLDITWDKRG